MSLDCKLSPICSSSNEYVDLEPECPDQDGRETVPLLKESLGELSLDEEALEGILDPIELKNTPIAVISIAGAFRLGKSFILNFFLSYLKKQGWLLKDGSWLQSWKSTENRGIKWKGGAEGDTRGILALKKPIIVEKNNGDKLAVLLLDTQGNFEHGRSRKENIGIFALSTLFSSLQIFNISKQIQTNDLEYLQCFVEFSKVFHPVKDSDVDSGARDQQRCFFQDLVFLVRDWQNPVSHSYGADGGKKYLESISCSALDSETHKYLKRAFSDVNCYLMPEPSSAVRITETENQTFVTPDIGEAFSQHLKCFVNRYLHPDNIKPKTLGYAGRVTAEVLLGHMKSCAKKIFSGESPEFPNLMKLIAANANQQALKEVKEKYFSNIEEAIRNLKNTQWCEWKTVVHEEILKAKKEYLDRTTFGRESIQSGELDVFYRSIEATLLGTEKLMQQKRLVYIEQKVNGWMTESIGMLQFRNQSFTFPSELEKIRDERLKLLPAKDDKDADSVADLLDQAKLQLAARCDQNIREVSQNNKVTIMIILGSATAIAGAAVGGPTTLVGIVAKLKSVAGALGLAAGCGVAARRWNGFRGLHESFQNRTLRWWNGTSKDKKD